MLSLPAIYRGALGCGRATLLLITATSSLNYLDQAALAQVESFMLKPGSNVGPATQIKPVNCVTAADGSVTCDTKVENPPSDTPAKPSYQPFKN
ncbi:MAG: hypothetical protein NTV57_12345 [Cyanobacteria bacterium]|nr:hypothetical protein [Cyanobacteriota bacterium]